ncbi:MAG: PSD1 and planctomycete cytochrome C domain-containing protein [Mariniblastus sp.]
MLRSFIFVFCLSPLLLAQVGNCQETKIDFTSQVKPILSDNCFACHGPDEAQRSSEFRLDQKESALSSDHSVIVPSDPDSSLLIKRILSNDPDEVMPPSDHRKKLSDSQKKILTDWIKQGANWSEHWAFQKPVASENPKASNATWPENYVDHYILNRLDREKIQPSPSANPPTLLRRLSFDLTGLPPTPEELETFESQIKKVGFESAYQTAVDRRLASPHFGERMAVYWLDLVRYADTVGYHGDQDVSVSPYRDYVINAFNQNMPFDQFTREQLAGDLLDSPTQDQLIASGYNRLGMMSAEGGVQPEEYLNKYASDRVRTTSSAWLGITLGCAECHDHKFDPFSAKEFYEFSSFFADIKEQGLYAGSNHSGKWGEAINVPDEVLPELLKPIDKEIAALESTMAENTDVAAERMAWEKTILDSNSHWNQLKPTSVATANKSKPSTTSQNSVLLSGPKPNKECCVVTTKISANTPGAITAFRLEALPDKSLPKQGPGRASNGNFVVTEFFAIQGNHSDKIQMLKSEFQKWPETLKSKTIQLKNATATFEQKASANAHPDKKWTAASAIDRDTKGKQFGWAVMPRANQQNEIVFQIDGDLPPGEMTFVIQQYHGNGSHTLGHFRISETRKPNAMADPSRLLSKEIQTIVKTKKGDRSAKQQKEISDYFVSIAPRFEATRKQILKLKTEREGKVKSHTRTTLVTVSTKPREIRVLARGDWMDKTGSVVSPGVPTSLGGKNWSTKDLKAQRATRLELANWITDKQNPLTSRVFVNRTWRMFFGSGISNVLDDLGSQGEPPSHPMLLDRLAIEFAQSDWDIKNLIRTMVLSKTYQQSSSLRTDLKEIDPENRLFARQSRFRLDAEFIRDHALATSGLLVRKIGGRSVKPYQPAGLYRHLNFPTRKYIASAGEDQYRRGIYTHWQRQFLHPAMKTFDAPSREECTAARPRSSTPLAALVLLNDPSYVEAAKGLAETALQNQTGFDLRINEVFKLAFSRAASSEEKQVLRELLDSSREHFEKNPAEAEKLLSIGGRSKPEKQNQIELAAWTSTCRAVINMHEFVLRK